MRDVLSRGSTVFLFQQKALFKIKRAKQKFVDKRTIVVDGQFVLSDDQQQCIFDDISDQISSTRATGQSVMSLSTLLAPGHASGPGARSNNPKAQLTLNIYASDLPGWNLAMAIQINIAQPRTT